MPARVRLATEADRRWPNLGVIDVATLSVIRRWAPREQMSIREIARRTDLLRNTVKKYLRAGEEMPRYAKRTSSSKLDP